LTANRTTSGRTTAKTKANTKANSVSTKQQNTKGQSAKSQSVKSRNTNGAKRSTKSTTKRSTKSTAKRNGKRTAKRRVRWSSVIIALLIVLVLLLGGMFIKQQLPRYIYPIDYFETIASEAADVDIDPYLVCAVIKVESGFDSDAVSSAGAVGLMQVMPQTGEWLAHRGGFDFTEDMLTKPEYNIRLGCQYLRFLLDYWQGDAYKAVASYNAGQSNVAKWLAEGIWDGSSENLSDIPFDETQKYVNKVFDVYEQYQELYNSNI
jgi:soluble lytic murein transglycosylase